MTFTASIRRANTDRLPAAGLMLLAALLALAPAGAMAKQGDRNQPVNVNANRFDGKNQPNTTTHLFTNVVITQGTLKVTGDKADIHLGADTSVDHAIVTGSPAHLQQEDDNGNLMTAHATKIDYNVSTGIAVLTGNAHVDQKGRGKASGDRLVYNTKTSGMSGESRGDNRVHLVFQPKHPAASTSAKSKSDAKQDAKPASAASAGGAQ
ncbi:lipopolysaccharide transport periplasmic protein LptA [Oleiagrimonas sp. C23AA]|uniref:lipopolysaccharide transport periplasmic protein LptA n=1 Tax=Oleiagrimonas sp. C23AA TaxID=2719047 RepID=UPI0014228242|nr:lipopolysaccharide transport periplasmic protein LptA [Oleiagrimonas sp. C23AA]NII11522.1 lipopolysaccharide transport periplasmic protein LptA [Oleiagrimonas sp. C23AA]